VNDGLADSEIPERSALPDSEIQVESALPDDANDGPREPEWLGDLDMWNGRDTHCAGTCQTISKAATRSSPTT